MDTPAPKNGTTRAVVYPRVSGASQRERQTIAAQLDLAPERCAREGWQLVRPADHYSDDGRTARAGNLDKRDGLRRLFDDAAAGHFDVVLMWDQDRLTRSEDWAERGLIYGALQRAGVKIADMRGQILDLNTSHGDLMASIGAWQAAEYNRKLSARVKAGQARAIAAGRLPRGHAPYGLRYDRTHGYTIDPERGPVIQEIFRRVRERDTMSAIADDLNARGVKLYRDGRYGWAHERISKLLRQTAYRGEKVASTSPRVTVKVPALISESDWHATHAVLALGRGRYHSRRHDAHELLRGVGTCGKCGASLVVVRLKTGACVYKCSNRRRRQTCKQEILQCAHTDTLVWDQVAAVLLTPGAIEARLAERAQADGRVDWVGEVKRWAKRLAELQRAEGAILDRFTAGKVSERGMDQVLAKLGAERVELQAQLDYAGRQVDRERDEAQSAEALATSLGELRALVKQATPAQRLIVIRKILRSAVATGHKIEIHLDPLADAPVTIREGAQPCRASRRATRSGFPITLTYCNP